MFWMVWIMWICKILETLWNIEIIFFWTEVDEPEACYIEWSKSEREKQTLYINAYIWNLEKWYWWTYFLGRSGDVENGLVDTAGEGDDWESSTNIYTLPCVKWIADGKLLYKLQ